MGKYNDINISVVLGHISKNFVSNVTKETKIDILCKEYMLNYKLVIPIYDYINFDKKNELDSYYKEFLEDEFICSIQFVKKITDIFLKKLEDEFLNEPLKYSHIASYIVMDIDMFISSIKNMESLNPYIKEEKYILDLHNSLLKIYQWTLYQFIKFSPNTKYINVVDFNKYFAPDQILDEIQINKKQSKHLLDNILRYEILENTGLIKTIQKLNILEDEKHELISQIMGIDKSNARKLFSNTYEKGGKKLEEIERKEYLVSLLKTNI